MATSTLVTHTSQHRDETQRRRAAYETILDTARALAAKLELMGDVKSYAHLTDACKALEETLADNWQVVPCPSYPGYSVSTTGKVYSHWKQESRGRGNGRGKTTVCDPTHFRELSVHQNETTGYLCVSLTVNGKETTGRLHCMMLDAFRGPCPDGMQGRHLDDNKLNNQLSNLAWGTPFDNAADRKTNGGYATGAEHKNAKLTVAAVEDILATPKTYGYCKLLAKKYGVSVNTVKTVLYRPNSWKSVKARM